MIMVSKGRKSLTSWSVDRMLSLYAFLLCSSLLYCSAIDTIPFNNSIADERGKTVISTGETFELGFFTPNESSNRSARYVGIWYYNLRPRTVVWVANRDRPLTDHNGSFTITEDGNLKVLDGEGKPLWSTSLESPSSNNKTHASLMDSGNLILMDDTTAETLWESFSNPTDTFLPGMKMDQHLSLTSWNTSDDPAPGYFMFKRQSEGQFEITNDTLPYWKSDAGQMLPEIANLLSNYSTINSVSLAAVVKDPSMSSSATDRGPAVGSCGRGMSYKQCLPNRPTNSPPTTPTNVTQNDSSTRLVISFSGVIQYLRLDGEKNWSTIWFQPTSRCGALNTCGNFGSCNSNNGLQLCKCLPGFEPNSMEYSGGCKRKSAICGESDAFLSLKMMRVREPVMNFTAANENECRDKYCQKNCKCLAYSYDNNSTPPCSIWTEDLTNIQEEYAYADGARNLSVRVNGSDIESTVKDSCKPCGTYMIPYPLSTGTDCGDPKYMNFKCNISSGQVSFKAAPNRASYRVTYIYPDTQKFVILQPKGAGNCGAHNSGGNILKPFQANDWCRDDNGNSSSDRSSQGGDEIEISWDPPPEPICNISSPAACKDWQNSTCKETLDRQQRCLCNAHFQWDGSTLSCVQVEDTLFCI